MIANPDEEVTNVAGGGMVQMDIPALNGLASELGSVLLPTLDPSDQRLRGAAGAVEGGAELSREAGRLVQRSVEVQEALRRTSTQAASTLHQSSLRVALEDQGNSGLLRLPGGAR